MNRREFISGAATVFATSAIAARDDGSVKNDAHILLGACRPIGDAAVMKKIGYDFFEWDVASALGPDKDVEWWKRQRDVIRGAALPLRSCNGFIPGRFRLTGPKADHAPALAYAEIALRRAEEVGISTIVFGSGGARNVPGDFTIAGKGPDLEKGASQYADFCRELARQTSDLKKVTVVIEPLRPNESNIINFVWQGVAICRDINSPRIGQLADFFHMMMGGESADSIRLAGRLLKHCHVASYGTRSFPGSDPLTVPRLAPYFAALKSVGYAGGVSCECGWGESKDLEKNLTIAIETMKGLV